EELGHGMCSLGGGFGVVAVGFGVGGVALAFLVPAAALATLGLVALLVLALHDQRLLGLRAVAADDQVAQDRVVEAEGLDQLVDGGLADLGVEQHVVGLDQVLDRVGQLAAAPVLEAVDGATGVLDQALVALDHRRHLLALVRVDQEHDFVMTHCVFLVDAALAGLAAPRRPGGSGGARDPGACAQARGSRKLCRLRDLDAMGRPRRPAVRAQACSVVKLSPQPHSALALGLRNRKASPRPWRAKSISVPSTSGRLVASTKMRTPSCSNTVSPSRWSRARSATWPQPEQPVHSTPKRSPGACGSRSRKRRRRSRAAGVRVTATRNRRKTACPL